MNQDSYHQKVNRKTALKVIAIIFALVYLPLWLFSVYISTNQNPSIQSTLPILGSDSLEYTRLSLSLGGQHCFALETCDKPEYFRTPGYPFFIYITSLGNSSFFLTTLIQIILVLATSYIIFIMSLKSNSHKLSLIVLILFSIEPSIIFHSLILLSDIPFLFFLVLATYLFFDDATHAKTTFAALLIGVAVLFRPIALFLPIILILGYLIENKETLKFKDLLTKAGILILGIIVVIGPWYLRNYRLSSVVSLSSVSAFNLFYYNVPMYLSDQTDANLIDVQNEFISKSGFVGYELKKLENSPKIQSIATSAIIKDIPGYLIFHIQGLPHFFVGSSIKTVMVSWNEIYLNDSNFQFDQNLLLTYIKRGEFYNFAKSITNNIPILTERIIWLVLVGLSCCSIFLGKNRRRMIVYLAIVFYFAILTGPVSYSRYRIPAIPFMLVASVYSFHSLFSLRKSGDALFK